MPVLFLRGIFFQLQTLTLCNKLYVCLIFFLAFHFFTVSIFERESIPFVSEVDHFTLAQKIKIGTAASILAETAKDKRKLEE